jgi:hypothetical protein
MAVPEEWRRLAAARPFLVELFIGVNLAFLALDIFVAHSVNAFAHPAEWIPFVFTIGAAAVILVNLAVGAPSRALGGGYRRGGGWWTGVVVGSGSVLVGVAGMLWHLQSDFFEVMTLRALVYSAPFVAPLAFTGLGLLLLANRLVDPDDVEWGQWVLLLAWAGFVGNFVLSLVDHAQNGFFYVAEWVPVVVAALVVGWLALPAFRPTPRLHLRVGLVALALAMATGLVGFVLHLVPVVTEQSGTLADRVVYGAPIFAPLLFPNLALLGALGVWDLLDKGWVTERRDVDAAAGEPTAA